MLTCRREKSNRKRPRDDKYVELVDRYFKFFLVNMFKDLQEKKDMIHAQIGNLNRSGNLSKNQRESLEEKKLIL